MQARIQELETQVVSSSAAQNILTEMINSGHAVQNEAGGVTIVRAHDEPNLAN